MVFFKDVSVLKVCKLNINCAIKFWKCSGKKICQMFKRCFLTDMKTAGKTFSCLFTYYSTKELYHWEKNDPSIIILMMANIVWAILIPQNYTDFHRWETRKLPLNLIQTSENNK